MGNFNFEGDTKDLSEKQLKFLGQILVDRGFIDGTVNIEPAGKIDDNFVANVKRVTIANNGKVFKFIVKIASKIPMLRDGMFNTVAMFKNEDVMYKEVLPKFAELQKAADIPIDEGFMFAECYGNLMEPCDELITLEDLRLSNFNMLDKFKPLSDDCVRLVLKQFAALHALSYALKHQEPETFRYFKSKFINTFTHMNQFPEAKQWFALVEADVIEVIGDNKHGTELKGVLGSLIDHFVENAAADTDSKYSVIQHGDSWTNNIMFRLEDVKPQRCCLIDYQLSKESSPVADIHYMVFACTDYQTRKLHYHAWMDYYHSELDKALSNYDLKVNSVYPRDKFEADQKRLSKQSLAVSVFLSTVLVRDMAAAAKMKEFFAKDGENSLENGVEQNRITNLDEHTLQKFKVRVKGIIDSFLELGFL